MASSVATKVTITSRALSPRRAKATATMDIVRLKHPHFKLYDDHEPSPLPRVFDADLCSLIDDRDYTRDRSRSPEPIRDGDSRIRDEPMNGRAER